MTDDDSWHVTLYSVLLVFLAILLVALVAGCQSSVARGDADPSQQFADNTMFACTGATA